MTIAGDQKNILEALDEIAPEIALEEENLEVETYANGDEEDDFTDFTDDQEARDD